MREGEGEGEGEGEEREEGEEDDTFLAQNQSFSKIHKKLTNTTFGMDLFAICSLRAVEYINKWLRAVNLPEMSKK